MVDDPLESTFAHSLIPAPKRANGDIGSLAVGKESLLRSDVLHVRFALPSGPFERRPTQVRSKILISKLDKLVDRESFIGEYENRGNR